MSPAAAIVVQLNSIEELFVAPTTNPFSTRAVDVLGEAGLDLAQKCILQHWPRLPRSLNITVQLPPDQISPDLAQRTRAAIQRHCAERIDGNRLQRELTVRRALRQLVGAALGILLALAFIALLVAAPLELLPAFLRGVLIVLALYACSVLSFDAVWSLAFDWAPYVQENTIYRVLEASEVTVEPALDA
jgi:hypothetical protein